MTSKVMPPVEGVDNVPPALESEFEEEETFESVLGGWSKIQKETFVGKWISVLEIPNLLSTSYQWIWRATASLIVSLIGCCHIPRIIRFKPKHQSY